MKRVALNIKHHLKQLIVRPGLCRPRLYRQCLVWPAFMLAAFMFACDPEESCVSQVANRYGTGFFQINEAGVREPATFYFSRIRAVERDTAFFLLENAGVRSLNLALNPGADITTFVFDHAGGRNRDTLQLAYERNFRMIAPDCGLELRFSNIRLVRHTFDSVRLLTTEINETRREGLDLEVFSERRCEVSESNRYRLGFFRLEDNGQVVPDVVNFDAVRDAASDSVFFSRNENGISSLELALDPEANRTVFLFENNENSIDTLTVSYTRRFFVNSPYCDPEILYTGIEIDYTTFGHVQVLNSELADGREGNDLAIFPESPCSVPDPIPYRFGFFRMNEQQEAEPWLVDFDEVSAIGGEPVFYSGGNEEGISSLEVFLNPSADTTTFIFSRPDVTDTLTVAYTRNPVPAGPAEYCEPYYRFTNLEIRYHTFERVERLTQELTENREGFDVEIYP